MVKGFWILAIFRDKAFIGINNDINNCRREPLLTHFIVAPYDTEDASKVYFYDELIRECKKAISTDAERKIATEDTLKVRRDEIDGGFDIESWPDGSIDPDSTTGAAGGLIYYGTRI